MSAVVREPVCDPREVHVLLVEDDPMDAELTQARLERAIAGCRFTVVDEEAALRAALTSQPFDVVIADFNLLGFSGREALEICRELVPSTPVILISGALAEDEALDLLRRGATDFVGKQRIDKLPFVVDRAIAQRNERRGRLAAERARLETEIHHRMLVDALKDYVVIGLDDGGRIRTCNAAARGILGCEPGSLIGREADCLFTDELGIAAIPAGLEAAARTGSLVEERWVRTPGGKSVFASIVTTATRADDGTLLGWSKVIRDMTVARRTAEALEAAREEAGRDLVQRKAAEEALREANRRKSDFLAILAHELRNPLAPIRAGLEAMRMTSDDPAILRGLREGMERQVHHMVRLIDDLLDLSRIDHGHIQLERREIDLVGVVRAAIEGSRALIDARGHTLAVHLPHGPVPVRADETRIAQVIANLLNNAASYTEPGGQIDLTVERDGAEAVVCVRDNGIGIPHEMESRIFESFTRILSAGKGGNPGGLGIGLSICAQLVRMHGGTIDAHSDGPGHGSTFCVRLPMSVTVEEAIQLPSPQQALPSAALRLLVADDNEDAASALQMLLQCLGHEARTVNGGGEALAAVAGWTPDVVLLDIGMPDLDGYEVCRQLRRAYATIEGPRPMIVALTGWGQERDRDLSREAGFDHHLVKPVGVQELETLFARTAEHRHTVAGTPSRSDAEKFACH